jgi:hypothetical protein
MAAIPENTKSRFRDVLKMKFGLLIVPVCVLGCAKSRLGELPPGCSGIFQSNNETKLTCDLGETRVNSVVFSDIQSADLSSSTKCGINVSGTSATLVKAQAAVVLLDANLNPLGSAQVANFLQPEVSQTISKFVSEPIDFSKGSKPVYFKIVPNGSAKEPQTTP